MLQTLKQVNAYVRITKTFGDLVQLITMVTVTGAAATRRRSSCKQLISCTTDDDTMVTFEWFPNTIYYQTEMKNSIQKVGLLNAFFYFFAVVTEKLNNLQEKLNDFCPFLSN